MTLGEKWSVLVSLGLEDSGIKDLRLDFRNQRFWDWNWKYCTVHSRRCGNKKHNQIGRKSIIEKVWCLITQKYLYRMWFDLQKFNFFPKFRGLRILFKKRSTWSKMRRSYAYLYFIMASSSSFVFSTHLTAYELGTVPCFSFRGLIMSGSRPIFFSFVCILAAPMSSKTTRYNSVIM